MTGRPLTGKRVGVLVETEFIHDEIAFYSKHVPEMGGDLHLLSYLWGEPSKDFLSDVAAAGHTPRTLTVNECVTRADPNSFDILICAANYVAVRLRELPPMGSVGSVGQLAHAPAVRFFAQAMLNPRTVKGAMCHALWILTPVPALLRDRRVICHTVVLADVHNAGAVYVPDPGHVVVDRDLVTARSFHDVEAYFQALVRTLGVLQQD